MPPTADEQLAIDDLRSRAERPNTTAPDELATKRERVRRLA